MNILEKAKRDIGRITSNLNEFAQAATLTAPNGETASVQLLHTRHHLGLDAEKQKWANALNAHVSVSEQQLMDSLYPYLGSDGKVNLKNHKVTVSDSTGTPYTYRIEQWFPNNTIGLITCILGEWQ